MNTRRRFSATKTLARKLRFDGVDSAGSIAMYLVMIISILLVTTTVLGARLSLSESRQASDVDQSNAAYYAAEAGVEEASRRLDINRSERLTLQDIFPRQWSGSTQHGDRAVLVEEDGDSDPGGSFDIRKDTNHDETYGRLSWRQRRVYQEPQAPVGILVKDETTELDTTELRRQCSGGYYAGEDGKDCDGSTNIFSNYEGVRFCWLPQQAGNADMEFTIISYPKNSPHNTDTDKFITSGDGGGVSSSLDHVTFNDVPPESDSYDYCTEAEIDNKARRYIFRIRALFPQADAQLRGNPDNDTVYRAQYRSELLDSSDYDQPLFIPDNTVLIDVVGQSGDVRRRIVARKQRQGRILGIFDYVLYSGDDNLPLCKVGVQQARERNPEVPGVSYNLNDPKCQVSPADNAP